VERPVIILLSKLAETFIPLGFGGFPLAAAHIVDGADIRARSATIAGTSFPITP